MDNGLVLSKVNSVKEMLDSAVNKFPEDPKESAYEIARAILRLRVLEDDIINFGHQKTSSV